jgi:hypothetical protein
MARAPGARPGYLSAHAPRPTAAPARRTAPPPRRRRARAAAAAEAAEAEAEAGGDDAVCAPAFVSVDNRKNKNFTVMEVSGARGGSATGFCTLHQAAAAPRPSRRSDPPSPP